MNDLTRIYNNSKYYLHQKVWCISPIKTEIISPDHDLFSLICEGYINDIICRASCLSDSFTVFNYEILSGNDKFIIDNDTYISTDFDYIVKVAKNIIVLSSLSNTLRNSCRRIEYKFGDYQYIEFPEITSREIIDLYIIKEDDKGESDE